MRSPVLSSSRNKGLLMEGSRDPWWQWGRILHFEGALDVPDTFKGGVSEYGVSVL
jgi:hypothetical protein